jgi:hypothetical protein
MRRLLRSAGVLDGTWESELESSVTLAQATLRVDSRFAFEMRHDDAATVWRALTRLGPLRGLALARGQAFVDALGADFVADLPPGPLVHSPEARLLVIERG